MDDSEIDLDTARAVLGLPAMRAGVPPLREDPLAAAGGRRFTVDELRRWAQARRRGAKGSDVAGRFLDEPDAYITPVALKRASTVPAKKVAGKKAAPAKKVARPAKRAAAKKAAAPVADAGPTVGAFKNIVTLDRAQKAAEAEMKKVETQQRNTAKAKQAVADHLRASTTNTAAEPHLKAAAREGARAIAGHAAKADEAAAKARDAYAKAQAATDLPTAIRHAQAASAAIEQAREANAAAQEAARAVRTAAQAKPRTPFEPAGKRIFDAVPAGYRKATPQEERDNLGNAETYSGMWMARDAGATKPQVRIKPGGEKVGLYSPEHHLAAERMKWKRVEKLRRILPPMRTALEAIARGEGGSGTDLQKQRLKDNAFSLLLTMATGMRPSDPGTKSTITDPRTGTKKTIDTYGSSTLRKRHVEKINRRADGSISSVYLKFPGKSGAENRIKVTDQFLMEEIARRHDEIKGPVKIKPRGAPEVTVPERDRELSPVAKSGAMNDMLREAASRVVRGMGMDEQIAENFGSLNDEEGEGSDPMGEVTGPFSNRTLRTLFANTVAPEIFASMAARRKPRTKEEFAQMMEEATAQAAARLGNQHATFKKNYLSALPFLEWMPQGNGPDGIPAWEDWWQWGKVMLTKPE